MKRHFKKAVKPQGTRDPSKEGKKGSSQLRRTKSRERKGRLQRCEKSGGRGRKGRSERYEEREAEREKEVATLLKPTAQKEDEVYNTTGKKGSKAIQKIATLQDTGTGGDPE